ncbi:engulfment and cell motility protein 1-like, partial [Diaphorina citri]|uniref:Engulfment and cell motility protein 1-like n=1 Tax=Diaphorina citri TaxID=121845 RepID=A0A3Q0JMV6_DIACI
MLAHCLLSFVELMDHGIVSWNILETVFIKTVADHVNNPNPVPEKEIVQASLSILESIALNSVGKFSQVENHLTLTNLVMHLQNQSPIIQQNAIALINALFIKAEPSKRKVISATMCSKQVRNAILTSVLQPSGGQVGAEMAHQLYVLQTLTLGLLEQRMNTKMDPQDQDAHDKIKELRRVAFEIDVIGGVDASSKRQMGGYAKDYKKLGFKYDINPAQDFTETPPGMLALDCMIYFARNHPEAYTKVVLENSWCADEHRVSICRTSWNLSNICLGPCGVMLAHCLLSFVELMDHGIVSWNILETVFIKTVADHVNNPNPVPEKEIVQASLSILESIALNSVGKFSQVENHLTLTNLVMHLQNQSPIIQQNAIALINALFIKAEPSKRKVISATMCSKQVRNAILTSVLQPSGGQ